MEWDAALWEPGPGAMTNALVRNPDEVEGLPGVRYHGLFGFRQKSTQ
jgi:hypothetical protein